MGESLVSLATNTAPAMAPNSQFLSELLGGALRRSCSVSIAIVVCRASKVLSYMRPSRQAARAKTTLEQIGPEALAAAVNQAAARDVAQWFFFITLMLTITAIVASTTDRVIFLQEPLNVPIFGIQLPLNGFYVFAPLVLLSFHFYLVVQLRFLSHRLDSFIAYIDRHYGARSNHVGQAEALLDNFSVLQLFLRRHRGRFSVLLFITVTSTLFIAPIAIFIFIQIRFLPYQSEVITNLHRFVIVADLCVLLFIFPRGFSKNKSICAVYLGARWAAIGVIVTFSAFIANIPGERLEVGGFANSVRAALFKDEYYQVGRGLQIASRYLHLAEQDLVPEDGPLLAGMGRTRSVRYRALRGAVFDGADLQKVDFTGSDLRGARFRRANLRGAVMDYVDASGVDFREADLRAAFFRGANLHNVQLSGANASGANFFRANLHRAWGYKANFNGASFAYAAFNFAGFRNSTMLGATFIHAGGSGAQFIGADLRGATFAFASIGASDFGDANLRSVIFRDTLISGVIWRNADLSGARFQDTVRPPGGNDLRVRFSQERLSSFVSSWIGSRYAGRSFGFSDRDTRRDLDFALREIEALNTAISPSSAPVDLTSPLDDTDEVQLLYELICEDVLDRSAIIGILRNSNILSWADELEDSCCGMNAEEFGFRDTGSVPPQGIPYNKLIMSDAEQTSEREEFAYSEIFPRNFSFDWTPNQLNDPPRLSAPQRAGLSTRITSNSECLTVLSLSASDSRRLQRGHRM